MRTRLCLALVLAAFAAHPAHAQNAISSARLSVAATGGAWIPAQLNVHAGDIVLVYADGQVQVGPAAGQVGPQGAPSGEGALEAQIGEGTAQRTGGRAFFIAEQAGDVKLRVYDTRYDDNSGAFQVIIIVVPIAAIPEPRDVTPGGSGLTSRDRAYQSVMISDLRNLVTAEEVFFADSARYTKSLPASVYSTSTGVTVTILSATAQGWAATATHSSMPGFVCAIFAGQALHPPQLVRDGEPACYRDAAEATPAPREPGPRDRAYQAATMADLRNLAVAEETFFVDSARYTKSLPASVYSTSTGVTVTILSATAQGWAATATHASMPGVVCAIFIGTIEHPAETTEEGQPVCTRRP